MKENNELTILILSCDRYSDLWKPFFQLFHTYWPECPYPVALGSNTKIHKGVKTLLSGPDRDWSTSFLSILDQIDTPYIFLWLDDIFPTHRIHTQGFASALRFMKKNSAKHVHGMPSSTPVTHTPEGFGIIENGSPYRAITLGFWDVSTLKKLLIPGENPWKFEIMGSYRSSYTDGFYSVPKPLFSKLHVVEKGSIFRAAYEYCQRHGIALDTSKRAILGGGFFLKSELQKIYFNAVIKIPWKKRLALMDILRKLVISY